MSKTRVSQSDGQHIVVLGAGFGGRDAAKRLARLLPLRCRITLIDRNEYLLYTPMLTEVAGRSVAPEHVQAPTNGLARRITFLQREVQMADLRSKTITLTGGETVEADQIVVALGSTTNYRSIPGAQENSVGMKTLEDARYVRDFAEQQVHKAAAEADPAARRSLLTFVIAGGGYTGVETIAALNDLVRDTAEEAGFAVGEISMVLIEPTKRLMAEMPETLARYAADQLTKDGIRLEIGVGVKSVEPGTLILTNGEQLPFGLLIWDTGIQPNPLLQAIECPKGPKGGIVVDSTFRVKDLPGVWAIGDCAEIPKPDGSGAFFEATAQNATREGQLVAHNIAASIRGTVVQPFRYKQVGELAIVSRRRGVAFVFGFEISGVLGWLMWRGIYLAKLPGMRQRLGVLSDWLRLLVGRRYVPHSARLEAPRVLQAEG